MTDEYRMMHTAPTPESGSPLYDLTLNGTYPSDVYEHPEWYGHPGDIDFGSVPVIMLARGEPKRRVPIFRAAPEGVTEIHDGDWVTFHLPYARLHAARNDNPDDDWPVIAQIVTADQLFCGGEGFSEWGYHGPTLQAAVLPKEPHE